LGHINLYIGNYKADQLPFSNDIIFENLNLLNSFNVDLILLKPSIAQYRHEYNSDLSNLLKIMEITSQLECFPIFLKDINYIKYPNNLNFNIEIILYLIKFTILF